MVFRDLEDRRDVRLQRARVRGKFTEGLRVRLDVFEPRDLHLLRGKARSFDPFRQRASRNEYAFSSSGLGLSIVQQLVHAMGGELEVDTVLGKGTRFSFVLDLPISPRVSGAW